MGKRNKGEQTIKEIKDTNQKRIKRSANNTVANEDVTQEISSMSTGNGKNKKIVFDNGVLIETGLPDKVSQESNLTSSKKRNKGSKGIQLNMESNSSKQNKKIVFTEDNDEGTEVTINRTRRTENYADEEPGDDEIDKFCDELDEEDNVQYDNWVKLIEAKLGPNKKKS